MQDRPRRVRVIIYIILHRVIAALQDGTLDALTEAVTHNLARVQLMYDGVSSPTKEEQDADAAFVTLADYVEQTTTPLDENTLESLSDALGDALDETTW